MVYSNRTEHSGKLAANAAVNYYSKHAGNSCMQQSPFTWPFGMELMGPFSLLQDRVISPPLAFLSVLQDW